MSFSGIAAAADKAPVAAVESAHGAANPHIPLISAPNYRAIIDRYGPAVVGVTVHDMQTDPGLVGRAAPNPGATASTLPGIPAEVPHPESLGLGSGFIISADGLVLTNAHVVVGADSVTVTLNDRREFRASVLGQDPDTDVAVLKIDTQNLPTVKLGNADQLGVGDYVLAIGSPYGFEETATSGIVSALHRSLPNRPYVPFIQTDAAVNPGNSGGPLFNAAGQVVGINAQIFSTTGGYEGLSFAIPINLAKRIADQIIATGGVQHPLVGVSVQQLTQPLADAFGLKRPNGALIAMVRPRSPASRAGLMLGDVILKCNGRTIRQASDVSVMLGNAASDDTIAFSVWRGGNQHDVSVSLDMSGSPSAADEMAEITSNESLGIQVRPLSADERKVANISSALLVVSSLGPARRAGIVAGDLLLAVNSTWIESPDQLHELVEAGGPMVALLIQTEGTRNYVAVPTNQ